MQREHFFDHLRDSGLVSAEVLAAVRTRLGDAPSEQLNCTLVDEGVLTPFQLRRIWAGQSKGLVLGQYRVLEELGRGGFGWVYKARHTLMNREVALKVILPELVQDSRARAWFRREVLATTQLQHPNIVLAYDANEVDDVLFLAMEFVDGPNLYTLVVQEGPLPTGLACAMMHQAARALHYAHEKGMVHRDIKPANLLVPRGNRAGLAPQATDVFLPSPAAFPNVPLIKIVDFGLARLHGQRTCNSLTLDKDKGFIGTPDYVSPEQARNVHDADIRSDLYSLGCTFYFALTGERPFRGESPLEIIVQHLEKEPVPLEIFRPEILPALASIIRRLMAKKPEQRFQSPADLIAELNFLFGSGPLGGFARPAAAPRLAEPNGTPTPQRTAAPLPARETAEKAGAKKDSGLVRTVVLPVPQTPIDVLLADAKRAPEPSPDLAARGARGAETMLAAAAMLPSLAEENQAVVETIGLRPLAPTSSASESSDKSFREHWDRWTAVVARVLEEGFASVSEGDYRALYGRLLETARAEADAGDGSRTQLFRRLVSVVEPWVTPRALEAADRETIYSLHERCLEFDRALGFDRTRGRRRLWLVLLVLLFALASLGGQMLFARGVRLPTDWSLPALGRFVVANPLLLLAVLVPLVVLGAVVVTSRSIRKG